MRKEERRARTRSTFVGSTAPGTSGEGMGGRGEEAFNSASPELVAMPVPSLLFVFRSLRVANRVWARLPVTKI